MGQFDPEQSVDATDHGANSTSQSTNEKCDDVAVHIVGDAENVPIVDSIAYPDGGLRAWATIAGAFILQFTGFGYINTFGVYQDFYVREYLTNYTPSEIGWIGGVQVFLNLFLGAITGRLFDKGYFYHLIISSIIIHTFSLFMLSLSHKNVYYQVFLTNGVGVGLASGLTYTASLAIPGHYFQKKRPFALGIVSAGSALGAFVHPIMLNKLINGDVGFHTAVKISASINSFLLIIAGCLMRTRLPPKKLQRFPIIKWLKEPGYLAFVLSALIRYLGLFYPAFYLQLYAITQGIDPKLAFYALSILNASSFFGRTINGYLAQKFGVFNLGMACTIGTGIISLSMIAVKDLAGTMSYAILLGLFSGACTALVTPMLAHLVNDPNEFGTRLGVCFGLGGILGLFSTPISGALLTTHYHWIRPILMAGLSLIVSGLLYGVSRHYVAKREGSQIV